MQSSTDVKVRISRYESIPMVSTLGLRVSESNPESTLPWTSIKTNSEWTTSVTSHRMG